MAEIEYIAHSGQKGMRWGVRKYQNYDGTLTEEGKLRYRKYGALQEMKKNEDKRIWSSKDTQKLSDKDLNDRINRMLKEKQYNTLLEEMNTKKVKEKKQHPLFKQIFVSSSAVAMSSVVTYLVSDAVKTAIAKHIHANPQRLAKFNANRIMREAIFKPGK